MSRSLLVSLLLVALAGCDSSSVSDYDGVLEVALVADARSSNPALRLDAIEDGGCGREIVVSVERSTLVRRVVVEGLGPDNPCDAVRPASVVVDLALGPELPGGYRLEVVRNRAVDVYYLDLGNGPPMLTAVRTTTTRLAR